MDARSLFTKLDALTRLLVEGIKNGPTRTLYLVPSTSQTLTHLPSQARKAGWIIVGVPGRFGVSDEIMNPASFMKEIAQKEERDAGLRVVVFTDQFVSAEHAPLLVDDGFKEADFGKVGATSTLRFYSAFELLMVFRFGYAVAPWEGARFGLADIAVSQAHDAVLMLLMRYEFACRSIGDGWLMERQQSLRDPKNRMIDARERLRRYMSTLMLSMVDEPKDRRHLIALERLIALRQRIPKESDL